MPKPFQYITKTYKSNCFIEAIKAKIKNPKVKIHYCPSYTVNGQFQCCHFMWSDNEYTYDFSDEEDVQLPLHKYLWYKGRIRRFDKNFGKKYLKYRKNLRLRNNRRADNG